MIIKECDKNNWDIHEKDKLFKKLLTYIYIHSNDSIFI